MAKSRIEVLNLGIEDRCTVDYVECLRKLTWKYCLYNFLSVLTLGFFWLLGYWSAKLKSRLVFSECSIHQATHFLVYNWDSKWSIIPREDILALSSKNTYTQSITFSNRHIRYFYDEAKEVFHSFKYDLAKKFQELKNNEVYIYPEAQRQKLHQQFGRCLVEIKVWSKLMLFLKEILSPYEMFQLYAIIYWLITQYYIFPTILLIASIFVYIYDVRLLQQGQTKLRIDSLIATVVSYISKDNNDQTQLLKGHSEVLVPGDMFYLGEKQIVPCDCIILKGSAFINEQYLTGNSIPVRRAQVPYFEFDQKKDTEFTLYMGTAIICVQHQAIYNKMEELPNPEYKSVLCLAVRTGYSCHRGQYLRSIIYPKRHAFKFFNESLSFLAIMFFINIMGFFFIFSKVRQFLHPSHGLILFLQLLTTAIPPTLPTAMSVGIGFAMRRLTALNIRCKVKQKILVGGRVDTVMIDSSNLVHKSEVRVLGFLNNNEAAQMSFRFLKPSDPQMETLSKIGLASTLAASKSESDGKYLGSVYDLEILRFVGAEIDSDNITIQLKDAIITIQDKKYHETNFIQSIVGFEQKKYRFVRGAWDKVMPLCSQNKLPTNNEDIIEKLTASGYQIFALAYLEAFHDKDTHFQQTQFIFLGFIVIQDKQEFKCSSVIQTLKSANIHSIILSKQNSASSLKMALKSSFITSKDIMYCQLLNQKGIKKIHKMYPEYKSHSLSPDQEQVSSIISNEDEITKDFVFGIDQHRPLQICMHGNLLQELHNKKSIASIRCILQKTTIFCNLQQKHYSMIVQSYQELGRLVSIVGDNVRGNAFKEAEVGLALTSSDLQALSHFSARKENIYSIVNLLVISKAALSCNFQTFKMMCLFSLTQFTTYIVLYMHYQELNNSQNLYVDLFIMCPIFICLSLTEPCSKLSKEKPPASLFSFSNVLSMAGLFVIQFVAQFVMVYCTRSRKYLLQHDEDSLKYILKTDQFNQGTYEATNIFVFSNFLYIGIALATSVSRPFRKEFYTNIPLVLTIILLWIYNVIIPFDFLVPESMEIRHLHVNWIPVIILSANLVCLLMYLYENFVLGIVKRLKRRYSIE